MGNPETPDSGTDRRPDDQEVRVLCKVDTSRHDLDVDWTKGAVFHFGSEREAERWINTLNVHVPGTLHFTTSSPGTEPLDPDYYLHYRPPVTK